VIHFATHGVLQDDQPVDSFLALGSASGAASNDGRLTAQEIYELDLQADLVVLSACRTGLGKISGDGIAGLTRAFFYAGTPSVMATLWDVADEPTSRLVAEFYRSYQRTHDKSQALRAAQLHLLRALRNGQVKATTPAGTFTLPEHPVFWAGFVLVGEP
jgi:CHAT domain-containing protein